MIRDPHYRNIVERLGERLDPHLFERCVADLLRDDFPTLVPISGGADAGMDGAIAEGEGLAFPLVCTTAKNVIGNLTKNLDSYVSNGGRRRRIVLVTSQALTPQKRRNLEKRAEEKGFELVQVYDREAMADRLYRSPRWCRELLDLTGTPSALSVVPPTRRPLLGDDLVGRREDLAWLQQTGGDLLLVGPPGSGKTFLLRKMALEGHGLFLASDDVTEVANAVREQRPKAIFVDDAHLKPELAVELRRLREEIGAEFSLVATAWTGTEEELIEALNLPKRQVHELGLLSRDEIVEVVENSGVHGPVELVREIVDQAEGRPGLAVSLAYLCLRGGVWEVVRGDALKRSTVVDFGKLVGEEATYVLAAFAVGGDGGMRPSTVANVLEMPRRRVNSIVTQLAAGGVIDRVRNPWALGSSRGATGGGTGEIPLSVRPPSLRYALVRDVFFETVTPMPIDELLNEAPDETEVARTLVRTAGFGADVPTKLLTDILERAGSGVAWEEYAALGEAEAEWVLEHHPEMTSEIADSALERTPVTAIPGLLDLAVKDNRPLNSSPDHPLRRLDGWVQRGVPGTNQAVRRRRLLLEGVTGWVSGGGDEKIVGQVLEMVLSPAFNDITADPGAGRTFTMRRGLLLPDELSELETLWPRIVELLKSLTTVPWNSLFEAIHDWIYLGLHGPEPPEGVVSSMRAFAHRMLSDLISIADGHPGVLHRAVEAAEEFSSDLGITLDPEFEVLFPREDLEGDWDEQQVRQSAAVRELVDDWHARDPAEVARRISELEKAAEDVGHTYPRNTPLLCEELAKRTDDATTWGRSLLEAGTAAELVTPFLSKAATGGEQGWEELVSDCLGRPAIAGAAMSVVLTTLNPPEHLLDQAMEKAHWFVGLIESLCRWGNVPCETLARLLQHENPRVSAAAAVGEWYAEPRGEVREGLEEAWKSAVIKAPADQRMMQKILGSDAALAHDWLLRRIEEEEMIGVGYLKPAVASAVSVLDREQRLSVLSSITRRSSYRSLVAVLVGADLELYGQFLETDELTDVHLWPLAGKPEGAWSQKAKLALQAGFSAEQVADAVYGSGWSWSGNESDMWKDWADRFRKLLSHEDEEIRAVARLGVEHTERRRERALESERLEAIYGR